MRRLWLVAVPSSFFEFRFVGGCCMFRVSRRAYSPPQVSRKKTLYTSTINSTYRAVVTSYSTWRSARCERLHKDHLGRYSTTTIRTLGSHVLCVRESTATYHVPGMYFRGGGSKKKEKRNNATRSTESVDRAFSVSYPAIICITYTIHGETTQQRGFSLPPPLK